LKLEAVILDFDGTIADTETSIIITLKKTLRFFGIDRIDEKEIKRNIGLPLKTTFERVSPLRGEELEGAVLKYRSLYEQTAPEMISLFPGVKNSLNQIFQSKVKSAVASSKGKRALVSALHGLGIGDLFSVVVGEQDVLQKKPAPDMVNFILAELGIKPERALVVGDTVYDIMMGKSAGCSTCAVTYGNHSRAELKKSAPDLMIDQFPQLLLHL